MGSSSSYLALITKKAGTVVPSQSLSFLLANDLHSFHRVAAVARPRLLPRRTTPRRQKICGNGLSRHRPVGTRKDFTEDKATTPTSSSPPVHRLNFFFSFSFAFCRPDDPPFRCWINSLLAVSLPRELFRDRSSAELCPNQRVFSSGSLGRYAPRCTYENLYINQEEKKEMTWWMKLYRGATRNKGAF